MSKSIFLIGALMCAMLLIGCSKSESTNREAAPTSAPAASPAASKATTTASAEKIGVPECDAFITSYEACVKDKVPAQAQAAFNSSLATWRKSWHDLAANPQTKATLTTVCKQTLDQAKQSLKAYNCTW
ncbi:MAG: hypothetical protein C5B55_14125 [Blastocatellia bacterium]|nr:MAG: hypothetical protein C5B55_14125 [Blastocatellia bacterium]